MRIISFSPIYLSYYFDNQILKGISLYGNAYFSLCFLKEKYDVKYIGNIDGYLNLINIDCINNNDLINKLFISDKRKSYICPYCNRNMNKSIDLNVSNIISNINEDDVIIYDDLSNDAIEVINNTINDNYLLLDSINSIQDYSLDELIQLFSNKFKCIVLDKSVYHCIKDKFNIDSYDIYEYLSPMLLIVFRSKYGADFVFEDNIIEKEIEEVHDEIENSGSLSAFSSVFIDYLINNSEINEKVISLLFIKASVLYMRTVNKIGVNKLVKIKKYDQCICNKFELNS